MTKKKFEVQTQLDVKGSKYPYLDMGYESHGRYRFRLWLSSRFVTKKENGELEVIFPIVGAKIIRTEKGTLTLVPDAQSTVHNIIVHCGYRGESSFSVAEPEGAEVFPYSEYQSPNGKLGISQGALINCPRGTNLKYHWRRTGRLYGGAGEGITVISPDGNETESTPEDLDL